MEKQNTIFCIPLVEREVSRNKADGQSYITIWSPFIQSNRFY